MNEIKRNPVARELASPINRSRVVKLKQRKLKAKAIQKEIDNYLGDK